MEQFLQRLQVLRWSPQLRKREHLEIDRTAYNNRPYVVEMNVSVLQRLHCLFISIN